MAVSVARRRGLVGAWEAAWSASLKIAPPVASPDRPRGQRFHRASTQDYLLTVAWPEPVPVFFSFFRPFFPTWPLAMLGAAGCENQPANRQAHFRPFQSFFCKICMGPKV